MLTEPHEVSSAAPTRKHHYRKAPYDMRRLPVSIILCLLVLLPSLLILPLQPASSSAAPFSTSVTTSTSSAASLNLELLSSTGGSITAVEIRGTIAFLGEGSTF